MRVTESRSKLVRHLTVLAMVLGVCALGALPSAASAEDEPFAIQFDQSKIQIGSIGELPLDTIASDSSLQGTIDEAGNVTIPKGSFTLPQLGLDDPVTVRGFMGIESPATGTFNRATGQLDLDATAGIWVKLDVAALADLAGIDIADLISGAGGTGGFDIGSMIKPLLSNLTCGFSPMNVHFTTESTSLTTGTRFVDGTAGTGAITAEWSQLGPFSGRTKILGLIDPCQMILDYLPQLVEGGLGGVIPAGTDLGGLDLESLLANLNDLDLGPSAITLTRTVDEHITDPGTNPPKGPRLQLRVNPRSRVVRAGRKVTYTVKVRNVGDQVSKPARVCLTGPGIGLLVRWRCRSFGSVRPAQTKTRRMTVRVHGRAPRWKARINFRLRSTGSPVRAKATRLLIRR
ncbi:MAG: hypothetical protein J0H98_05415 [Solirubrobacterales bacterium]|nr:hypothetical protein [Solirubrobacterales bacterium]